MFFCFCSDLIKLSINKILSNLFFRLYYKYKHRRKVFSFVSDHVSDINIYSS